MADYFEVPTAYFKGYLKQLKKSLWKKPEGGSQEERNILLPHYL
jgi:hypothetical protein